MAVCAFANQIVQLALKILNAVLDIVQRLPTPALVFPWVLVFFASRIASAVRAAVREL